MNIIKCFICRADEDVEGHVTEKELWICQNCYDINRELVDGDER